MAKTDEQAQEALQLFLTNNYTNKRICHIVDISEPTFYKWKKQGRLTDGKDWDTYRQEHERQQIQKAKEYDLEVRAEEQQGFLKRVQQDVEKMYETVRAEIQSGNVEVQVNDVKTLVKLYAMLDSQAAEKVKWMEQFALSTFEIAFEIMSEKQFALFKTRMLQLTNKKKANMGSVANATLNE